MDEELWSNICFFGSIAKGKHGKNEKKFDKNTIIYMIPPAVDFGNVAQLVEQGPFKAKVPGSSPGIPTILLYTIPYKNEGFFVIQNKIEEIYLLLREKNGTIAFSPSLHYETPLLYVPDDDIFCLPLREPLFLYDLWARDLSYHPALGYHTIHRYDALSRGIPDSCWNRDHRGVLFRSEVVADYLYRQGVLF